MVDVARMTRWMHASVASYLKTVATNNSLPCLAEGLEERTTAFQEAGDRVEVRFNGPYTKRQSGVTEARCMVNVLITSNFGSPGKSAFALDNALGAFHDALDAGIPLFQIGNPDDNKASLGCMQVVSEVKVFNFGQIDPKDRTRQGMVTATFSHHFDN